MRSSRRVAIRNTASSLAPAIIVFLFGLLTYTSTLRESASTQSVAHTHDVIEQNQLVLSRLLDAETGERGFLLSGDSLYLEPYHGASADAVDGITRLRSLVTDNPVQLARVDSLRRLTSHQVAMLDSIVVDRKKSTLTPEPIERLRSSSERSGMDSIRRVVGAIIGDERRLLALRSAVQADHARTTLLIVGFGTIVAAILAIVLNGALSRYANEQSRLAQDVESRNEELRRANATLSETNATLAKRTAEAETANHTKSRFLASMSHDLRTPLNAIMGYVDLLQLEVRGPLTPDQASDLGRIARSSAHLLALIDDVLDFAQIEAGRLRLQVKVVNLREVVASVEELIRPQVNVKGLHFSSACDPGVRVMADPTKFDQILTNLLANAVKFTAPGGEVAITCDSAGGWANVHVRDTGRGIAPDQLQRIFEPFVQVQSGSATSGGLNGVGLGLAISRDLARAMHGDLTVESSYGVGSIFTIRLPTAVR